MSSLISVGLGTLQTWQASPANAVGLNYAVGDTGPGGGKVFYASVAAFEEIGAPCGRNCHYLEWAPTSWAANDNNANQFLASSEYYGGGTGSVLGTGYNNTRLLATDSPGIGYVTTADDFPVLVRAYRGGSKSDWFIPSAGETYLMSQSTAYGTGGFTADDYYWSSTANNDGGPGTGLQLHVMANPSEVGDPGLQPPYRTFPVRPIRAFGDPVSAPAFSLTQASEQATVGTAISGYSINSTGGAIDSYSISPVVGNGLSFNTTTGLLSGSPTATASAVVYTVTGTNSNSSTSRTFSITVKEASPLPPPPPMTPESAPGITFTSTQITCTPGKYSQKSESVVYTLLVGDTAVSTHFSNAMLPVWLVPWAGKIIDYGNATTSDASWDLQAAWKGKSVSCITLAYANHATGSTSVNAVVPTQ